MNTSVTLLAIETSTRNGSVAVMASGGDVLFSESFEADRSHNSLLFEPLRRALASADDLTAILVGTGPGSYTGVRIGIAAALGVSLAKNVPVAGISSLCAAHPVETTSYAIIGDARRDSFFWAEVRERSLAKPPELCSRDELAARARAWNGPLVTFDRADLPVDASPASPTARDLATAAFTTLDPATLQIDSVIEPIYLRAPYITKPKPKRRPG